MIVFPPHPTVKKERWLPAVGLDGYYISSQGRVLSTKGREPRILKGHMAAGKYVAIGFKNTTDKYVHHMVCEAFRGPRPSPDHEARHLNGKTSNNTLRNLNWGTRSQNMMDRVAHGTSNRGERHGMSFLTKKQVAAMRRKRATQGTPYHALAAEHGIATMTAYNICKRKTWK